MSVHHHRSSGHGHHGSSQQRHNSSGSRSRSRGSQGISESHGVPGDHRSHSLHASSHSEKSHSRSGAQHIAHNAHSSHSKGPSLDRQITVQDVECLREAFALFDPDKEREITAEKLGKVRATSLFYFLASKKKRKIEW